MRTTLYLILLITALGQDTIRDPIKKHGAGPLFQIHDGDKWGFMNRRGKIVIRPKLFDDEGDFFNGLARVRMGWNWGYVNEHGRVIIPCHFQDAGDFNEGLAPVLINRKWGFIDRAGNFVIQPQFQGAAEFREGLALFEVWETIDNDREKFTKDAAPLYAYRMHNGHPMGYGYGYPVDARYGYVDHHGTIVIAPTFSFAQDFSDGLAHVFTTQHGYIDKSGGIVIKGQAGEAFSNGLALAAISIALDNGKTASRWGFIDRTGQFVIPPRFEYAQSFSEGLAAVALPGARSGYIDKTGRFVIPPRFDEAFDFSDGLALVSGDDADNDYFIDKTGKPALIPQLHVMWPFSDGLTVAGMFREQKYIDHKGKVIAPYDVQLR